MSRSLVRKEPDTLKYGTQVNMVGNAISTSVILEENADTFTVVHTADSLDVG